MQLLVQGHAAYATHSDVVPANLHSLTCHHAMGQQAGAMSMFGAWSDMGKVNTAAQHRVSVDLYICASVRVRLRMSAENVFAHRVGAPPRHPPASASRRESGATSLSPLLHEVSRRKTACEVNHHIASKVNHHID